jgi:hypothetical protein
VPALRQLSVSAAGRPGAQPDPLHYEPSDPWDLRYLAAAIDASRQLDTLARSFTAQGVARTTAADYERLLPPLRGESSFDASYIEPDRAAGDTLVGAAVAVLGGRGSFSERWHQVFDFKGQGAEWGLVVLDQGVTEDAVIDLVTKALGTALEPLGTPEVASPPVTVSPGSTSSDDPPGSSGGEGRATTTTTAPPPTTTTTAPPDDSPATLLPPLPPIDIPGLPPISIPLIPPLATDPLPDSGGLLDGLLAPVSSLLGALVGPGGLLDLGS